MQNAEYSVALTHLVDKLKLENCTPNVPIDDVKVTQSDVNRPALQLAGVFDYFDSNRIQSIGQGGYTYNWYLIFRCQFDQTVIHRKVTAKNDTWWFGRLLTATHNLF